MLIYNSMKWVWVCLLASLATLMAFFSMQTLIKTAPYATPPKTIDVDDRFVMPDRIIDPIIDEALPTPVEKPLPTPKYTYHDEPIDAYTGSAITFSKLLEKNETNTEYHARLKNIQPSFKVLPIYPARALARGIEGYVDLRFTVDAIGRPQHIQVVSAEPAQVFNRAAIKAVNNAC